MMKSDMAWVSSDSMFTYGLYKLISFWTISLASLVTTS